MILLRDREPQDCPETVQEDAAIILTDLSAVRHPSCGLLYPLTPLSHSPAFPRLHHPWYYLRIPQICYVRIGLIESNHGTSVNFPGSNQMQSPLLGKLWHARHSYSRLFVLPGNLKHFISVVAFFTYISWLPYLLCRLWLLQWILESQKVPFVKGLVLGLALLKGGGEFKRWDFVAGLPVINDMSKGTVEPPPLLVSLFHFLVIGSMVSSQAPCHDVLPHHWLKSNATKWPWTEPS